MGKAVGFLQLLAVFIVLSICRCLQANRVGETIVEKGGYGKYKNDEVNKLHQPRSITAIEKIKKRVLYQFDSPGAESTGIKS